jgi:2'-5' RNA ligase
MFWYLTVPHAVADPALDDYLRRLGTTPWVDVVPPRWWHLTLTEIGYADDLDDPLLDRLAAAVRRVKATGPLTIELGPLVRFRTALALEAGPDARLRALQDAVRGSTQGVLGPDRPVVHPTRFRPHVSVAYLNDDVPGRVVHDLLDEAPDVRDTVEVDRLTLAAVTRQDRHYRWRVVEEVTLTP